MNASAKSLVSVASIAAVVLALGGSALFGTAAVAATPAPLPSKVVRYDDLDLDGQRGAAVLYARIQAAAAQVCGEANRPGGHFVSTAWKVCVATAVDAGVRRVDRPALTAYHAARTAAPSLIRVASRG